MSNGKKPATAPKAQPGAPTTLSEPVPAPDEPPRLAVAINAAAVAAPAGTVMDADGKTPLTHEIAAADLAKPETVVTILKWINNRMQNEPLDKAWAQQDAAIRNWSGNATAPEEQWAQATTEALFAVTYGGTGPAYEMKGRQNKKQHPGMESWESYIFSRLQKKVRSYRFFASLSGKGCWGCYNVASWREPEPLDVDGKVVPPSATVLYRADSHAKLEAKQLLAIEHQIQKDGPIFVEEANDDPAVAIISACQHLTSYGAICRGFQVHHLNGSGYAAQSCASYPIFNGTPTGGKWYPPTPPTPAGAKPETPTLDKTAYGTEDLLTVEKATKLSPPLAPGTIFTYDPDGGLDDQTLWLTQYEAEAKIDEIVAEHFTHRSGYGPIAITSPYTDENRAVPVAKYEAELLAREPQHSPHRMKAIQSSLSAADTSEKAGLKGQAEQLRRQAAKWQAEEDAHYGAAMQLWRHHLGLCKVTKKAQVPVPRRQWPGSHIGYVMRVHPSKKWSQHMDTGNGGAWRYKLMEEGHGALVERVNLCIIDANRTVRTSGGGEVRDGSTTGKHVAPYTFVGMGVVPAPPEPLDEMAKWIRGARPVGLFRVILTHRTATLKDSDILFMSRLCRMYGDKKTENYISARILWSLRNTPGFSNVRPWIATFIPKGTLARSMWARGGREMRLSQFMSQVAAKADYAEEFKGGALVYQKHYLISAVFSNCADRPGVLLGDKRIKASYAGKAEIACRYKDLGVKDGEWPDKLNELLRRVAWNKPFASPLLGADAAAKIEKDMPAMFRDGEPA
jgi:hypothetical protein